MAEALDALQLPPVDDELDAEAEELIRLTTAGTLRVLERRVNERLGLVSESTGGYWSAIMGSIALHKRQPDRISLSTYKRAKEEEAQPRIKEGGRSVRRTSEVVEEEETEADAPQIREEEPLGEEAGGEDAASFSVHV